MKTILSPYWKIIGALLVIFVSGSTLGYFAGSGSSDVPAPIEERVSPQTWEEKALASFRDSMELTQEQIAAISPIFNRASTEVIDRRDEALFEIYQRMLVLHDEVHEYLDPEQQKKLAKSREKMQLTIRKRFPSFLTE